MSYNALDTKPKKSLDIIFYEIVLDIKLKKENIIYENYYHWK